MEYAEIIEAIGQEAYRPLEAQASNRAGVV